MMQLIDEIQNHNVKYTGWRKYLHSKPELGFDLKETTAFVEERLREFGIDQITTNVGRAGIVAVIEGQTISSERSIGLRADMDALPIKEQTGLDYASTNDGQMHACGHDGHTTMLLAAAQQLANRRNFNGKVVLIFQPAEERGGGGKVMIDDGLFERWTIHEVYGMHTWAGLEVGQFAICSGPMLAASGAFEFIVRSKGGHAAFPHRCVDPILVGRRLIDAFDDIVSRETDPLDSLVISTTKFEAGHAFNVIADTSSISGTIRSLDDKLYESSLKRMQTISESFSQLYNCQIDFDHIRGYPVLVNNEAATQDSIQVASSIVGNTNVNKNFKPLMGAEDFAFMLQKAPGAFVAIGQGPGPFMHHPKFDFNDEITPIGATYWCRLVEKKLPL